MHSSVFARKPADFIVLSAMRSGSNNLQDALNEHPEIECGGEVLNPEHLQLWGRVFQPEKTRGWARLAGARAVMAVARLGKRRCPAVMLRIARRPWGREMFGFRVFGNHIACFGLHALLDELHGRGTRFIHLVRRDTFDQAVSLVRAQTIGIWKASPETMAAIARVDLVPLTDRIERAAGLLHGHKVIVANIARRCGAMQLDFDEYTRDERCLDRIQEFLGVRTRVALRHVNMKSPPIDAVVYDRLREELDRRGVPLRFNPEAM